MSIIPRRPLVLYILTWVFSLLSVRLSFSPLITQGYMLRPNWLSKSVQDVGLNELDAALFFILSKIVLKDLFYFGLSYRLSWNRSS
jgi:hypothetical protein